MAEAIWHDLSEQLRDRGVSFAAGLTDAEVATAESRFSFRFPPDLRAFLQTALPSGESFPDWRNGDEFSLREWMDVPLRGVLFDVRHGFWLEEWGTRPNTWAETEQSVRALVADAPKLIPVCQHRMMPAEPNEVGNPVFSVHQTDIIWYGFDLQDYLQNEWNLHGRRTFQTCRPIRFWGIERFQSVRWAEGSWPYDNSDGLLPK
ncbi:MAG: SMI1/KNR4 family protein [Planctomycetes bacterium]|nr:SMI1/KNR4 family protein [Planctomycetota bacterium]